MTACFETRNRDLEFSCASLFSFLFYMTVLSCLVTTYRTLYGIWNTIFQEEKRKTKKRNDKCMYVMHTYIIKTKVNVSVVLCVRASYILHILLIQYILNVTLSVTNCFIAEIFA